MSKVLINQYYSNLDKAVQFGKSMNETTIRSYFWMLLNEYAHKHHYEMVTEVACRGTKGKAVRPDGILKNAFGLDVGLWESKDEKDIIDDEIDSKQRKGYPLFNILFEDSQNAVLFQRGVEIMRVSMRDPEQLHKIITAFISYKDETIYKFEDALGKFTQDIPVIVETLRKKIEDTGSTNKNFKSKAESFLALCKAEINPEITEADIREMMIQHILTSDIFNKIFDDPEFHKHNNIACELENLIAALFTYSERKNLLGSIEHYYDAINSAAAGIPDHHEKQKFLKVLYENFYKVYNPKAADRLGVVYTPNEIVKFMIESTDHLLHKHFGKTLADKNVEILDPATGTGTFITSLIDYLPNQDLKYKYNNEIHANEVAILPYYVANLNIEFTFKQKMGYYEEFKNLCFVDTLDNTDALQYSGKQHDLFGLSYENSERIKRQNSKKISVIIGNPPYNANQLNENENNKNRTYPDIDRRIKDTYIKNSTAQKTKVYDMYARFYRWASDRLDRNGILAFITNRSFIDSRTFDGFRKCIQEEFNNAYIIDTKSDVRTNPKIAGTTHNVFGIQTGVAIMFLVKKANKKDACKIEYSTMDDFWRKEEKLEWLRQHKLENIEFENINPDKTNNWINLSDDNDWDNMILLQNHETNHEQIFLHSGIGVSTNRDEWVFDEDQANLIKKVKYFIDSYTKQLQKIKKIDINKNDLNKYLSLDIKWSDSLKSKILCKRELTFSGDQIINFLYRPFTMKKYYSDKFLSDRLTSNHYEIFGNRLDNSNKVISFSGLSSNKPFTVLASSLLTGVDYLEKTQCLPLYRYDSQGKRTDNITDWGLEQFVTHYKDKTITKEDIFNYTYAVLHDPAYRQKYELNLKREFPRLPFYENFRQWADWGKALMDLHINYETVQPYDLKVNSFEVKAEAKRQKELVTMVSEETSDYGRKYRIKTKLRADIEKGIIEIDELTYLTGVPKSAWDYKLGNRSALEWILDQYKEKKPSDPTIAEKFNNYRFADYKDHVIDLLKRVCTVSVETVKIVEKMGKENE